METKRNNELVLIPKTIRNQFDKHLTYNKLLQAHRLSRKGKTLKKEIILFNLKQEEYINWLYDELKNEIYAHGGYKIFMYMYLMKGRYKFQDMWTENS